LTVLADFAKIVPVLIPLLASLLASGALAQAPETDNIPNQTQELERKRKAQAEADKAAAAAKEREILEGKGDTITYEQILKRPDDVDLNYRYAQQQIARGEIKAAAGTLERILMVKQGLPKVKLLYAVVLYRLDNLNEAQATLNELKKEKMPESLRSEINQYLSAIAKKRRRGHVSVTLGAGFDFDENRNAAPASGKRLALGNVTVLDRASTRRNDTSKTMLASLGGSYDLGFQAGHEVFSNLSYYRAEQTVLRTLNLQNYGVEGGLRLKGKKWTLTPAAEFSYLLLAETTYQRSHGGSLRFDYKINQRLDWWGDASYGRQDYNRTKVVPTGPQRSGNRMEGELGLKFGVTPTMKVTLSAGGARQTAQSSFNAYQRAALNLGHQWLLPKGQFLLSNVIANFDQYDRAEPAVSTRIRADETLRMRATYGAPLNLLWKPLKGLVATFTYEYFHAESNLINNTYTNNKVSSMVTWRWSN
jgi:hypothetical protein